MVPSPILQPQETPSGWKFADKLFCLAKIYVNAGATFLPGRLWKIMFLVSSTDTIFHLDTFISIEMYCFIPIHNHLLILWSMEHGIHRFHFNVQHVLHYLLVTQEFNMLGYRFSRSVHQSTTSTKCLYYE